MSTSRRREPLEGNEAVARVAYAFSEVVAIYPITPSSGMGEASDAWSAAGRKNLWGQVPRVIEMQSEAGAAGALHGAATSGSLATTFTSSQGLLLMIPTLYKVAGELAPCVFHVAARAVATHALSIFGDHSDVMAARQTGVAMLCAGSVQEAHDLAAVAHAASLETRLPFLHFFDGFRTSHEIADVETLEAEDLRALLDADALAAHRARGLSPDRPVLRGSAQNPDIFFQSREAANPFYLDAPGRIEAVLKRLAARAGRSYELYEYRGHPRAERVVAVMGSAVGALGEAADALIARGERVGVLQIRLYRPFDPVRFARALPATTRALAVLDRTKEPGAPAEPLFLDAQAALIEARALGVERRPFVIGGRYGLSSKEFTPAMAAAVFAELAKEAPKRRFTVGVRDDLTKLSLTSVPGFDTEDPAASRAVFFGLGSDGTVGANKQSIKLIAEKAGLRVQGYFVYDSKKAGSTTVSHLRFGPNPIRSTYLIREAEFVACHHEAFLARFDVIGACRRGGTLLLNARPDGLWERLPPSVARAAAAKGLRVFAIDAAAVAKEAGLGRRVNTVMQTCFFSITGLLPGFEDAIKESIRKAYASKGGGVLEKNFRAVDRALAGLREVPLPAVLPAEEAPAPPIPDDAPYFVRRVIGALIAGRGDDLPVSAVPADGAFPTGTAKWEKRAIAEDVPVWEEGLCIQCSKCALVCPHAAIRAKAFPESALAGAPADFRHLSWKGRELPAGTRYSIALSPDDCTGCRLCVEVCPAKDPAAPERKALNMAPIAGAREREARDFGVFSGLPRTDRELVDLKSPKSSQLLEPLFEFSGACAGCGETPYLKILSQLFGDRLVIANATGCSSIFGGNLPTTPWTTDDKGRGPAWSNSLFEDNAEFGLGMRLALDARRERARGLLSALAPRVGEELARAVLSVDKADERQLAGLRAGIVRLKGALAKLDAPEARDLLALADDLSRRSVWAVGGDGWAYDIGFGGLDHVLRGGADVKILVLDTGVYSNTGGQASKATPRAAVARFATNGKKTARKDLAQIAMACGGVYVAQVAFGASDAQTLRALNEAESYPGPAIVIAYAHCVAHGYDLGHGLDHQKLAVESGYWPLLRYDPSRPARGEPPLILDSRPPSGGAAFERFISSEARFQAPAAADPEEARLLLGLAEKDIARVWAALAEAAKRTV
ncbi:MAG: pyruvate:ferredoxin (flavodoxin) oxidoreductase [Elusimicrobia bacterium]|nr:pyruvate:ferredoxin (flavodoxin) oxidoreductase [Elusimicrobiota bacterium]